MAEKAEIKEKESEIKAKETGKINILKKNPWIVTTTILVIVVILLLVFLLRTPTGKITGNVISEDEAGDKIMEFVSLQIEEQDNASISSVEEVSGLYEVNVLYNGREIPLYITKDGQFYTANVVPIDTIIAQLSQTPQEEAQAQEVPKTDKPQVELFVMSYCPYGTQAEKGILPVMDLLKDKADIKIRFVHYTMHGEKEEIENKKQMCIREEQAPKFSAYMKCFLNSSNADACIKEAKIDSNKLSSCMENNAEKYKQTDSELSQSYGVQGSPTLIVNGVEASSGRSPSELLGTICSAFSEQPDECNQKLLTETPSAGFGYSATGATGSTATCG